MTLFTEMNLSPEILKSLAEAHYETLTPIQDATFAPISEGRDVLAMAETGSGKTSACAIPLMTRLDAAADTLQALILVPTRELALQYVSEISKVAKHTGFAPFAVFGGMDMEIQRAKLNHGVHILVATPGRLIDLLRNSNLSLRNVRTVVLDEADEMLKMGFIDDVDFILSCIIQSHQTLLFSATMPSAIKHLVQNYLHDPLQIELNIEQRAPKSLRHHFLYTRPQQRIKELLTYLRQKSVVQAIVFSNSRVGGEKLLGQLKKELSELDFIHGGIDQARRTGIYNRFKRKTIRYLIATDIASRGLDFTHVSHVINFDFPKSPEIYTHRTGRTGRMGREGVALSLITDRDLSSLKDALRINQIEPHWLGEAPDLSRAGRRSGGHGRGRGRGHSGGNRPRRRRRPSSSESNG